MSLLWKLINWGRIGGDCAYHLISKDAIDSRLVKANEPIETVELVVTEFAADQNWWLLIKPCESDIAIIVVIGSIIITIIEILSSLSGLAFTWAEYAIAGAERTHLVNSMGLNLVKLLGLFATGLQPVVLHEDKLRE